MDSFDAKIEKANAILRYRKRKKITTLFRFVELVVFLIMFARFFSQLPFAFKITGEYFRGLSFAVLSPRFVFIVGNVIIVVLFFKSGRLSTGEDPDGAGKNDLYEFVQNCGKSESITNMVIPREELKMNRSQSENLMSEKHEVSRRKLRRTVTERSPKSFDFGEKSEVKVFPEDELSSEEFRRTVEAFIARQQKSLRDEEFAPMIYVGA